MSSTNLQRMLAEKREEIFSAILSPPGNAQKLLALRDAAFTSLLTALGGKDLRRSQEEIIAAARAASVSHSLTELIGILDQLETAIFESVLHKPVEKRLRQYLLQTADFFSNARRDIVKICAGQSSPEQRPEVVGATEDRSANKEQLRAIHLSDEVMHQMLDPSIGPERVLRMICDSVLKVTTADALAIHILNRESRSFELKQFMSGPALQEYERKRFPEVMDNFSLLPRDSRGLFRIALEQKRPVFSSDIASDPRIGRSEPMSHLGVKAMLVVPMLESGRELGFMSVALASARTFEQSEIDSLTLFADQAAIAWRNAELYNELKKSERRYRNLIENAIDIIFILDPEGRFISANRRAKAVLGYNVDGWIGRHFSEIISTEDLPHVQEGWERGLKGGDEVFSVRVKNAGGEDVYLDINSSLIEEEGALKGLMCIARDATAETRREEEFRQLHESVVETNKKLEESMSKLKAAQAKLVQTEKLSAMTELISGVAHELNNPLTGILGYSQLLLESLSDSEHHENLQRINNEAMRCRRIVQSLQAFARGEAQKKEAVDINEVIRGIVELRRYQLRSDGIRLTTSLTDEHPTIRGNLHQLQQAILNVLNNAHQSITASRRGENIEIRTWLDKTDNCVRIAVSDDGAGILPENKGKIFDPFFTTREVGEATGLGLSFAYGIVQEHGGQISVESTPNKGATFEIQLPFAGAAPEDTVPTSAEPQEPHAPSEKRQVLVVDDEEVIVDLLTDILAQLGMEAEKAYNGNEALQKIATRQFDFIICDLKMPGMDGRTLYGKLKQLNPELSRRVIFSTGDTLSRDFKAFRAATDCKFVDKPFMVQDLKDAIEELGRS